MCKALRILPGACGPFLSHLLAPALGPRVLILWTEPLQLSFSLCVAPWERVMETRDKIIQNAHKIHEIIVWFLRRQKRAQAKVCFSEIVVNCRSVSLKRV